MKKVIVFLFLLSSVSFISCSSKYEAPAEAPAAAPAPAAPAPEAKAVMIAPKNNIDANAVAIASAPAVAKADKKATKKKAAKKAEAKIEESDRQNIQHHPYILASGKRQYAIMRVFFATDRNRTLNTGPTNMFGDHEDQITKISYGYCDISIPHNHRMGEIETPSIWRFEFSEDPEKHVMLQKTIISPKQEFFHNLSSRVKASKGTNAFVFVHGYNVSFEEAAKRTAQISYDLDFDGAPVFYSWPSCGTLVKYTVDEQNIELTQTNLKNFLKDFFTYSEANNVYLIAHSMGNRALTRAVTALLTEVPANRARLKEVILAAPDIDARVFKQDIAPALASAGRPVTLYASSKDKALVLSNKIHGFPRAGDSKNGVVVVPGIETIDATAVDTDDLIGHGYFADDRSVLGDIFTLIHNNLRADKRFGLQRVDSQIGTYWEFKH